MQSVLCVSFCAFLLASAAALAEAPAVEPHEATKEEYLACLIARSSAEEGQSRLSEGERKHKDRVAKFQVAEEDLKSQVKRHFPTTQREVESYNKAVTARNASVQSLNNEVKNLQEEQDAVNRLIVEANGKCSSLVVSPEVEKAAEEERRKSLTPPSSGQPPAAAHVER